jgi:hypothetical protein
MPLEVGTLVEWHIKDNLRCAHNISSIYMYLTSKHNKSMPWSKRGEEVLLKGFEKRKITVAGPEGRGLQAKERKTRSKEECSEGRNEGTMNIRRRRS